MCDIILPAARVFPCHAAILWLCGWNFRFRDYFRLVARFSSPKWQRWSGWHSSCLSVWCDIFDYLTVKHLECQMCAALFWLVFFTLWLVYLTFIIYSTSFSTLLNHTWCMHFIYFSHTMFSLFWTHQRHVLSKLLFNF